MRFKRCTIFLSVFIAFAFAAVPSLCLSKSNFSEQDPIELHIITGRVEDSSGALLPRTLIQVRSIRGELAASAYTNDRGEFLLGLPEGEYSISAILAGFAPIDGRSLEVPSSNLPIKLRLEIPSFREQVVVTATKTETPLAQIGSSTSVVLGEELSSRGIFLVGDALRDLAGVGVVQSGGTGQLASLFLRGGESDYTKVLVDGIPMNEPGGAYNFANLSTSSIDRIELVRGPQSALFGSDAMAGVIQIFTRRGKSEGLSPKPSMAVEGGTYATLRYGGALEGSSERVDYFASFSRFDTDNNVDNGSFNNTSIAGNLGLKLSHDAELRAIFRSEAGRAGTPGPTEFGRPNLDAHYRFRNLVGSLAFTHRPTVWWTQKLSYAANDSRQTNANLSDSGSYVPKYQGHEAPYPRFDYKLNETRKQRINYQSDFFLPHGHLLTAGADYEYQSGIVGDPSFDLVNASRKNSGGYIQDQWALRNRIFTTVGVRLEHNESYGFFASPRLSIALLARQPSENSPLGMTRIKANFGLGIKEPTLLESYGTSMYHMGNPDLLPEQSTSFDVGIEQCFNSSRSVLELTFFHNHFSDQIGFAITDYATFAGSFFNMGKSRARGVEAALRQELFRNLEISGAYTFLDSEILESSNESDPAFANGQWLFRRPRHSGNIGLRWKPGRWTLSASGLLVGSRVDSDYSGLGLTRNEGYGILNIGADFRLFSGFCVYAALNNVTNESYMEVLGYPALGRHFRIGLRAGF